jgi:hypothetical protein
MVSDQELKLGKIYRYLYNLDRVLYEVTENNQIQPIIRNKWELIKKNETFILLSLPISIGWHKEDFIKILTTKGQLGWLFFNRQDIERVYPEQENKP